MGTDQSPALLQIYRMLYLLVFHEVGVAGLQATTFLQKLHLATFSSRLVKRGHTFEYFPLSAMNYELRM